MDIDPRRWVVILCALALVAGCAGGASPDAGSPSPSTSAASGLSTTGPTALTAPPGYTFTEPASADAAKLAEYAGRFHYPDVAIHRVEAAGAGRILLVVYAGTSSDPSAPAAAAAMASEIGTQAGSQVFTEDILGEVQVEHSAATFGVLGSLFLYSFSYGDRVYWVMSDRDMDGGRFVEALVRELAPGASSSASASHTSGVAEPQLVAVTGYGYADLAGTDATEFGITSPPEGWQLASTHLVTPFDSRVILVELVPTAELAKDKNAMAVAADMAGAILTDPSSDRVYSETMGGQKVRHSHFTSYSGAHMHSVSFLHDGTVYWLLCDEDLACTTFARALAKTVVAS